METPPQLPLLDEERRQAGGLPEAHAELYRLVDRDLECGLFGQVSGHPDGLRADEARRTAAVKASQMKGQLLE